MIKNLLFFFGVSCYCQLCGIQTPLGLAVCTLLGTGYAVDIYNGEALYEHNWGKFMLSHVLFMKLPAGPLVRYRMLREQFSPKKVSPAQMSDSIPLFIQGIAKQVILGVPQTMHWFDQMQQRITGFVAAHSGMTEKRYTELMLHTGELVMDVGTMLDGKKAVKEKLIDQLGGISDALEWLYREIERTE